VEGYHGLVKTLVDNIYYYQDELGSTSHVADVHGALLEYYKYDLYGKPTYWLPSGSQLPNGSTCGVKDLHTGARWIPEIGLYDDRNRFMSPDLGRFLQPDPIGFKGDASNLYRYCGNDWGNRTDPMGTQDVDILKKVQTQLAAVQQRFNDKVLIGYGATQLSGLTTKIEHLSQAINGASVEVTGQGSNPPGAQAKQSGSARLPTSFRVLEGETIPKGTWKHYEYQAYYGPGKPVFNGAGIEIEEKFKEIAHEGPPFRQTIGFKHLDSHGWYGDDVGYHGDVPRNAIDKREQTFYARQIGDQGPGTMMSSHFLHISTITEGKVSNQVIDEGSNSYFDEH
jgi:RHS repeat-associated protein